MSIWEELAIKVPAGPVSDSDKSAPSHRLETCSNGPVTAGQVRRPPSKTMCEFAMAVQPCPTQVHQVKSREIQVKVVVEQN